ncbi:hypothetical protein [Streptococcus thoraltensis]|uniref:hypothetical protein n=1 Tax=Streptococcus thoraltensis TaxID=55085 RepID=UPI001F583164|nr:hypothetical protein [Streptococcus thoraltensis]
MSKEVDYVQFVRDFERQHGRPPTAEELELEQGTDPLAGIVTWSTPEEVQAEMDRINASYKPTIGERVTDGLSLLGRGLFKAVILLFQTPIYLTLFFFNLIKATIAVIIMWFVSKFILLIALSAIGIIFFHGDSAQLPKFFIWIYELMFGSGALNDIGTVKIFPNPAIDMSIITISILFLTFVATFTKIEHKQR